MNEQEREAFVEKVLRMASKMGMKAGEFRSMLFEMNERVEDDPELLPAYSPREAEGFFKAAEPLLRYMKERHARGLNPMEDEYVIVTPERAVLVQGRFCLPYPAIGREDSRGLQSGISREGD